ncbi:hypothetical protein H6G93_22695 [Nostoc sp. FACHB-973]|nr:hypothetical protein [Nostoc sp. FACHB-973]
MVSSVASFVQQSQNWQITISVPLTPIQHWFFQQNLPDADYFNQSAMLDFSAAKINQQLDKFLAKINKNKTKS